MTTSMPTQRPSSVSAVVALTWIAAILDLVGGAVLVFFASTEEIQSVTGASETTSTTSGWVTLAIGIVVAVVAIRLGEGSSGARLLVTTLMALRVGTAIWVLIVVGAVPLIAGIFDICIIGALFMGTPLKGDDVRAELAE